MAGLHNWAAAVALAAIGSAVPAQAQADCWADREIAAAQVRDMQTLLMVAALRCRAAHIDISADYDGFVTTQKAAIDQADLVIKQHFAQAGGAQSDYDRFVTSLANGFGDDETTEATCAEASALAHEASATVPAALGSMAMAKVFPVALPGGSCATPAGGVALAVATTPAKPEDLPPLLALAAPPAAPAAPATLPADIVAAMAVMARFQASQPGAAPAAPAVTVPVPVETAQTDAAPAMAPVQIWSTGAAAVDAGAYRPTQGAAIER